MGRVKAQMSVSLDGYLAGPNQGEEHPLGEGGGDLHEWAYKLSAWQEAHGRDGGEGEGNPSNAVIEAAHGNIGAVVMGRNMFARAREAAGERDVAIAGGGATIQQAIAAGLLDELLINQVPILLGAGTRLFDDLPARAAGIELTGVVQGPDALHLTYAFG